AHERTRSLRGRVTEKCSGNAEGANKDRTCPGECQRAHDVSSRCPCAFAMTLQDGSFRSKREELGREKSFAPYTRNCRRRSQTLPGSGQEPIFRSSRTSEPEVA